MSRTIIVGGTLYRDPAQGTARTQPGTVVLDGDSGAIEAVVAPGETVPSRDDDVTIDAAGLWLAPAFVELYAAVPDPGLEHREDVATATAAGARGGYATVYTLPHTAPAVDCGPVAQDIITRAAAAGGARLVPHAAATKGNGGEDLAPLGELADAGCRAACVGDYPIASPALMRRLLEYASAFDMTVLATGVDRALGEGLCDEGVWSTRLGLPASPAIAERIAIERDCALAELTGGAVHFARVSTAQGLAAVARAKERGVNVTCSCTPHHLHLTAAALTTYDPHFRVWPPLRSDDDVRALRDGVASGLVDAIVSDHRPLHREDKRCEFMQAEGGISGLETTLGLVLDLVHQGAFTAERALAALTAGPCSVVREPSRATLEAGSAADVVLIDPEASWLVDGKAFASKGKNTPFGGRVMQGRAVMTFVAGQPAWDGRGEAGQ